VYVSDAVESPIADAGLFFNTIGSIPYALPIFRQNLYIIGYYVWNKI